MRKLWLFIVILLAVSCNKEETEDGRGSKLVVNAEISQDVEPSKAVVTGKNFKQDNTMGLFVYHSETPAGASPVEMTKFELYGKRYGNIVAKFYTDRQPGYWKYKFADTSEDAYFDNIYLLKPTVSAFEGGLAVVAYAPWIKTAESITQIPFTIGGTSETVTDLMWAKQNQNGDNYRIVPDGNGKTVKLTFQHALSMIKVSLKCAHSGSKMTVSAITLKKKTGATTPLYSKGSMNAMTGVITGSANTSSIVYDFTDREHSFQTAYVDVPMLICPVENYGDGDYILEFKFNGQSLEQSSAYVISSNDVGGKFDAGKVYSFKFTFDNHIRFDGVQVSTEWIETAANKETIIF